MEVAIDLNKSIEQNAAVYYERSKKAKRKLVGAQKAIGEAERELEKLKKQRAQIMDDIEEELAEEARAHEQKEKRRAFWYDSFRWFFASNGMLVVGGRDATSNDILIKKQVLDHDLVFHTEAAGSPFFVIKTEGKEVPEEVLAEVAQATATFSRSWKLNLSYADVYWVTPSQISKTAEAGEYLGKGSFMIRGKRNQYKTTIKLAVGLLDDGRLMAGPPASVAARCAKYLLLDQGGDKKAAVCKKIVSLLGGGTIDEGEHVLPAGTFKIRKR